MGFLEVLTLIFVTLKLLGLLTWSWFWVFSPIIFALAFYFLIGIIYLTFVITRE